VAVATVAPASVESNDEKSLVRIKQLIKEKEAEQSRLIEQLKSWQVRKADDGYQNAEKV
jgi:hypothetical protein